jgi:uncharacterized membrane protein
VTVKRSEDRIARRVEQRLVQASFTGPIPPPSMLSQYNDIIPMGAERIMAMAEKQHDHRIGLEKYVVHSNSLNQRLGVILGFVLAVSVAGGGFWLVYSGRDATGIAAVITSIAGPSSIFIWGRTQQKKERAEKIKLPEK